MTVHSAVKPDAWKKGHPPPLRSGVANHHSSGVDANSATRPFVTQLAFSIQYTRSMSTFDHRFWSYTKGC